MSESKKIILGIETSCDDTSLCLLEGVAGEAKARPTILAHMSFNQERLMRKWGGVVPEIAARNHMEKLTPLLGECFLLAKLKPFDVDAIAVTTHPGLLGPLLTGLNTAKTLALIHEKPLLSCNHLFAHLEAIHLTESVPYPYLGMLVSGGHSMYLLVRSSSQFEVLGTTIDDAAGEAFDKGGKLIGLGYPAGKLIDDCAVGGDANRFEFPIGLRHSHDAQLSFSGVKTALRTFLEKNPECAVTCAADREKTVVKDLCASYQKTIVDALVLKAREAVKRAPSPNIPIVVGGGVACNSFLRGQMQKSFPQVSFVKPEFCTDNGAMIANFGLRQFHQSIPFPECLSLDAQNRYVKKGPHK